MSDFTRYEEAANAYQPKPAWYHHPAFPLLPVVELRRSDPHNTYGFNFHWLLFRTWMLDAPTLAVELVADSHWGFGFVGTLLYLRWTCCIPLPVWLCQLSYNTLWRKPRYTFSHRKQKQLPSKLNKVWWFLQCIFGYGTIYNGAICWFSERFFDVHDYPIHKGGEGYPDIETLYECHRCKKRFSI